MTLATARRYLTYSAKEIRLLLIYAITMGFLFSFNKWANELGEPSVVVGITNWISHSAIAFLVLLLFTSLIKYGAGYVHHKTTFVFSIWSVALTFFFVFLTQGQLLFFIPPFFRLDAHGGNLFGGFFPHPTLRHYTFVTMAGMIALSIIGWIILSMPSAHPFVLLAPTMMLFLLIYSLVPFDLIFGYVEVMTSQKLGLQSELEGAISFGTGLFYRSVINYSFLLLFIVLGFFFIHFFSVLATLIITLVLTSGLTLYWFIQKKVM